MRDVSLPPRTRALAAAALLLPALSCGPKVVVARLATPTAGVSVPALTPTPRPKPRIQIPTPPSMATPTPGALPFPAPRLSAAATATATATRPGPSPTATATARAGPARSAPSSTSTATASPARPAPSPTATPSSVLPDTPAPPPSPSPAGPSATAPSAPAASLIGEWDFRAEAGSGVIAGTLRFHPAPEGPAGAYIGLRGNATQLSNLYAAGSRVSFDLVSPTAVWHLEGTVSGDSIEGTFQTAEHTIRWTALRKPPSEPAPAATRRPSQ